MTVNESSRCRRLAAEIKVIMRDLDQVLAEGAEQFAQVLSEGVPSRAMVRSLGSVLHDFYTAIENLFQLVASEIDGGTPTSSDWHKRLLRSMSEPIDKLRPAVISHETEMLLQDFLGFRHVFRNIYGFRLDWDRIRVLLEKMPKAARRFKADIEQFHTYLLTLANAMEEA